jgi:hypothetical protein
MARSFSAAYYWILAFMLYDRTDPILTSVCSAPLVEILPSNPVWCRDFHAEFTPCHTSR